MSSRFLLPRSGKIDYFDKDADSASILEIDAETKHIDINTFNYTLKNVSEVIVNPQNKCFAAADGILYNGDQSSLIWYPPQISETYFKIPDNVEKIGEYAFCSSHLQYLEGGSGLKFLSPNFCTYSCRSAIKAFQIQSNSFTSVDGVLYNKAMTSLVACPNSMSIDFQSSSIKTIKCDAFSGNSNLSDVILNDHVQTIENGAFSNSSLTSFTGGFGLRTVGLAAFAYCKCLEIVVFQDGLIDIQIGAFNNCRNLQEIHIPKSVTHIGYDRSLSTFSKKTTIYCKDHTVASKFAKDHGFSYRVT